MLDKSSTLEKVIRVASTTVMRVSMAVVLVLMFLGAADVIGRYFFNSPIAQARELSEVLLVAVVYFALAYTQLTKGHITIEILYNRFSPRLKAKAGIAVNIILLCLFGLMAWRGIASGLNYMGDYRRFVNFRMPQYPFQFFIPLGSLIMCLVLILEIVQFISEMRKEG